MAWDYEAIFSNGSVAGIWNTVRKYHFAWLAVGEDGRHWMGFARTRQLAETLVRSETLIYRTGKRGRERIGLPKKLRHTEIIEVAASGRNVG